MVSWILPNYLNFAKMIVNVGPEIIGFEFAGASEFIDKTISVTSDLLAAVSFLSSSIPVSIINYITIGVFFICCSLATIKFLIIKLQSYVIAIVGVICLIFIPFVPLRGIALNYARALISASLELGTITLLFKGSYITLDEYHQEFLASGKDMSLDNALFVLFLGLFLGILSWVIPNKIGLLAFGEYQSSHRGIGLLRQSISRITK